MPEAVRGSAYKLFGTVEAGKESRALIDVGNRGVEIFCALGQECRRHRCTCQIDDAIIIRIGHEHIWLDRAGDYIKVESGRSILAPAKLRNLSRLEATKAPDSEFAPNVRILLREIASADWISLFESGSQQERITVLLRPLGLRTTDVIKKIQGKPLASAGWIPIDALKGASEINIEIEREGRPIVFKIRIKEQQIPR